MKIGMIGLGWMRAGHIYAIFNQSRLAFTGLKNQAAMGVTSLADLTTKLVWPLATAGSSVLW